MASFFVLRFKKTNLSDEKVQEITSRVVSEIETLLPGKTTSIGQGDTTVRAEVQREAEGEAAATPVAAKKPKKTLGSFYKRETGH